MSVKNSLGGCGRLQFELAAINRTAGAIEREILTLTDDGAVHDICWVS